MADNHSRFGVFLTILGGIAGIMLLKDPFTGILWSQVALSLQLPLTVFPLVWLTSSSRVMGPYANTRYGKSVLWLIGLVVSGLNAALLVDLLGR